jgi:hypothetical protein
MIEEPVNKIGLIEELVTKIGLEQSLGNSSRQFFRDFIRLIVQLLIRFSISIQRTKWLRTEAASWIWWLAKLTKDNTEILTDLAILIVFPLFLFEPIESLGR